MNTKYWTTGKYERNFFNNIKKEEKEGNAYDNVQLYWTLLRYRPQCCLVIFTYNSPHDKTFLFFNFITLTIPVIQLKLPLTTNSISCSFQIDIPTSIQQKVGKEGRKRIFQTFKTSLTANMKKKKKKRKHRVEILYILKQKRKQNETMYMWAKRFKERNSIISIPSKDWMQKNNLLR